MQPVTEPERIASIDVLRGFALLGILLINVIGFGLPIDALHDPLVWGGVSGADLAGWTVAESLVHGAMFAIFSMLFGAGVLLFTRGKENSRNGASSRLYYRRSVWLIVFGLVHAYVMLMPGDILFAYGVAALAIYPLRKLRPEILILLGCLVFVIVVGNDLARIGDAPAPRPSVETLQLEIEGRRSGYATNFMALAPVSFETQTANLVGSAFWRSLEMMLIGAGLFGMRVFSAARTRRFYLLLVAAGYGVGLLIRGVPLAHAWLSGMDPPALLVLEGMYDLGRLPLALGHVGLVMLVCRAGWLPELRRRLGAVGRLALTHYVLQTLLMVLFFDGVGLGRFAMLTRHELVYVVAAVWLFQLALSPWWLARFRFGPAEWLWRSLTYGTLQPMRRDPRGLSPPTQRR